MNGARRRLLQGIAAIAVVGAGAWFAVVEVRQRFTHVHETDARVTGDLVTVSARVAGRLVEFAVASGDRVERDQLIARIDAREPILLLETARSPVRRGAGRAGTTGGRAHSCRRADPKPAGDGAFDPSRRPGVHCSAGAAARARTGRARSRAIALREAGSSRCSSSSGTRAQAHRIEGEHRMAVAELEESIAVVDEARGGARSPRRSRPGSRQARPWRDGAAGKYRAAATRCRGPHHRKSGRRGDGSDVRTGRRVRSPGSASRDRARPEARLDRGERQGDADPQAHRRSAGGGSRRRVPRGGVFTVGSGPSAVPPPGALRCSRARIRAGTSPRSPSGCRCVSTSSRPASVWRRE